MGLYINYHSGNDCIALSYMKKTNIILLFCLCCLFIPYKGALQYLSHLLLIFVVLFFNDYYKLKPILYLYGYGIVVFCIQYIFLYQDVYLANYFLSLVYAPLIVLLFPGEKLKKYTIDLEKILKLCFLIYALLLWYQAFTNWWTPESVGGVHGIIKGPHINAQLYLLISGFYLFKEGIDNKSYAIFFLITALFCDYNLATLIYFFSLFSVLLLNIKFNKKYFKYIIAGVLIFIVGIFALMEIAEERNYLFTVLFALSSDLGYSGKIGYIVNFITEYIYNDLFSFMIGTSPGNGGSRSALLLTDNFLDIKIPGFLVRESFYVKENVYPYLYGVSDIARGTINQPFSSLIAVLSEFGIMVGGMFILYLKKYVSKLKGSSAYSHTFIIVNFITWFVFTHSLEFLPYIVLFHLLILVNSKNKIV